MRVVVINEAEALLEPFWDAKLPGTLDPYEITVSRGAVAGVKQGWCAVEITFERADAGASVTMSRRCEIDTGEYDRFVVFASIPSWVTFELSGIVDGDDRTIIEPTHGSDTNTELEGPIAGETLGGYLMTFTLTEARPAALQLVWTGLADSRRRAQMEARKSPYSSLWPGLILEERQVGPIEPTVGIFLGRDELERLRRRVRDSDLDGSYRKLVQKVAKWMIREPERDVGKHVPNPDRRWVRDRDMRRPATAGVMEIIAFVGLVESNYHLLRMAARMALSAAHCELWSESIIGTMPGTTWHHRSFTEETYCRAVGLVLDWAGSVMTGAARDLLIDAIAMKGLPRIESDFRRMEYIRHMNQGIVFSSGRIVALLALLSKHPRYSSLIDEAEADLHEMIAHYVKSDGGTLEGPAYWSYTFSTAMPIVYALARHRGKSVAEYASEPLRRTAGYGLGMLSPVDDGSTWIPVNDAHAGSSYPPALSAAFADLTGNPEWHALYRVSLANDRREPDVHHLIMAGDRSAEAPSERSPTRSTDAATLRARRFVHFPEVGQAGSVRLHSSTLLPIHFHITSGPTYGGHYHEDKGAFLLSAGDELLAADRGVTDYHHPETRLIGRAGRHNLLYPELTDGRIASQPPDAAGGRLVDAKASGELFMAVTEQRDAWMPGLFERNIRRVFSPHPSIYLVDDEVVLREAFPVSFRVNTRFPASAHAGGATILAPVHSLYIVPINWSPDLVDAATEGIDSDLAPITLVRLLSEPAREHRLLTALVVLDSDTPLADDAIGTDSIAVGGSTTRISEYGDCRITLAVEEEGVTRRFSCDASGWRLPGQAAPRLG